MLTIITRSSSPLTIEYWKWFARLLLRKRRGPSSVVDSLIRGLKIKRVSYILDGLHSTHGDVLVLSGVQAMERAIADKKLGEIGRLIIGPNIPFITDPSAKAYKDDAVDIILVPSKWIAEWIAESAPRSASKIRIWPSGVSISGASTRSGPPVIYLKNSSAEEAGSILSTIRELGINPTVLTYGTFTQEEYYASLRVAPYLVCLGGSESQGLALQEAWARDVPTFVRHVSTCEVANTVRKSETIAAPYLSNESGGFFKNTQELRALIDRAAAYTPKQYCDTHLSDEASVDILLKIIDDVQQTHI